MFNLPSGARIQVALSGIPNACCQPTSSAKSYGHRTLTSDMGSCCNLCGSGCLSFLELGLTLGHTLSIKRANLGLTVAGFQLTAADTMLYHGKCKQCIKR